MKVLFTICLSIFFSNVPVRTYDLTITIPNIKNTKGGIHVSVYSSKNKSEFTKIGQEYKVLDFKAESAAGKYVIKGLPEGEYAIAIYHDENGDKKCNTNIIGIPKEGYGFTRITKLLSTPKFDDSKILVNKNISVPISLIY
jgi:uncharacterized protein (DUF2141 family)